MLAINEFNNLKVAISRWNSQNESEREYVLYDIVSVFNDILSPKEIDSNLDYIRNNLIPTLFTEEEFNNIVIPYCERAKKEYRGENKFPHGTKVFIDKCTDSMSHFPQLCEAVVEYTYAEKYGGRDYKSYCLKINGEIHAWYPEEVLREI